MINNTTLNTLYCKTDRELDAYILVNDTTRIGIKDNLKDFKVNVKADIDGIWIGQAIPKKFECTIIKKDLPIALKIKDKLEFFHGIKNEQGTYVYQSIGSFFISSIESKEDTQVLSILAYDKLKDLQEQDIKDVAYPLTIKSFLLKVSEGTGLIVDMTNIPFPDFVISKPLFIKGEGTVADALKVVAQASICFVNLDGNVVKFKRPTDTSNTINLANVFRLKVKGKQLNYNRVVISGINPEDYVYVKDDNLILRDGIKELKIAKNPILEIDKKYFAPVLLSIAKTISFNGLEQLSMQSNPLLEIGDIVTINGYNVAILEQDLTLTRTEAKAVIPVKVVSDHARAKGIVQEILNIERALIGKATVEDLKATNAEIENLIATKATITDLLASKARIDSLEAQTANINTLIAQKASITDLTAVNADINTLKANDATMNTLIAAKANIADLTAANAKISQLEAKGATIDNLLAGNITAANLKAGLITATSGLIANGAIKDAMIADLSATKITSGIIYTNKVAILNQDGTLSLTGSLLRMWDAQNRERISLGKDTSGNFNFKIRGTDGTTLLIDETGVKNAGITDGAINDAKVAANANIQGSKLDIKTVIGAINNDGTTTLKSSKIYLDDKGQTLNVAFNSLTTAVSGTNRNFAKLNDIGMYSGGSVKTTSSLTISNSKITINNQLYDLVGFFINDLSKITELTISCFSDLTNVIMYYKFDNSIQSSKNLVKNEDRWETTIAVPSGAKTVAIGLGRYPHPTPFTVYYLDKVMINSGNIPLNWTVAPEDIDNKITNLTTSLTLEQGRISSLISEQNLTKGIVDTTSNKLSTLEQNVNSFKSTVASTYETINHATGTYSTKAQLSTLEQTVNSFKLSVAETYSTKTELANISVGGRNLLLNTLFEKNFDKWIKSGTPFVLDTTEKVSIKASCKFENSCVLIQNINGKLVAGETYTVSAWVKTVNIVNGTKNPFVALYGDGTDSAGGWFGALTLTVPDTKGSWQYISKTFQMNAKADGAKVLRFYLYVRDITGDVYFAYPKLEKGNKPTDWTPAPEDLTDYTNTKFADLQLDLDGFKSTVGSTYLSKNDAAGIYETKTKVATLESNLNGFKATVNETYTTKTDFNNLSIGGKNLFKDSNFASKKAGQVQYLSTWGGNTATATYEADIPQGVGEGLSIKRVCTASGTGGNYVDTDSFVLVDGETYTISQWMKSPDRAELSSSGFLMALNKPSTNTYVATSGTYILTPEWKRYSYTFTVPQGYGGNYVRRHILYSQSTVYEAFFKLEKGNKATDWSPAPEDTQAQITTINNSYSSLQQDVSGFKATVSSTYLTKNDATGLYTSKTEFSNLQQNVNGFKTTVYSKSDTDSKISTVQQTVNNLDIKFSNKLSAAQYLIDGIAIKAYGAGIQVFDKVGSTNQVLGIDTGGNLLMKGTLTTYRSTKKATEISDTTMKFYDFNGTGTTPTGEVGCSSRDGSHYEMAMNHRANSYSVLGSYASNGAYNAYFVLDKFNNYQTWRPAGMPAGYEILMFGDLYSENLINVHSVYARTAFYSANWRISDTEGIGMSYVIINGYKCVCLSSSDGFGKLAWGANGIYYSRNNGSTWSRITTL